MKLAMKTVKAWAVVSAGGDIETAANMPRVFFDRKDAADEAWKFRTGSHVEQVEITAITEMTHGATCVKAAHGPQGGYLHADDDDSPYDVDGCRYCGRCHIAL